MILIDADNGRWQAVGTPAELTATLIAHLPSALEGNDLATLAALVVGCQPDDVIIEDI
ncbi:hypothetical protein H7347_10360 [Corynebacterium sp. zg-331]|uniref:hypothetical protein n=1 Tax=unclassified Corynebacterium TaxID=2624378 RepID=UPI001642ED58|nr:MULTISPECIES: hypothetical protein [unclassified Corynebacterium]MBC3186959.1 hypothetical protein [Corynebacterium sp. zg-331]